jgi:hypothetical protein
MLFLRISRHRRSRQREAAEPNRLFTGSGEIVPDDILRTLGGSGSCRAKRRSRRGRCGVANPRCNRISGIRSTFLYWNAACRSPLTEKWHTYDS